MGNAFHNWTAVLIKKFGTIFSNTTNDMRKHFLILFLLAALPGALQAQTRGIRIGYIDMEYILEKVPDYAEAKNQLELKAQKWKQEIELKKNEITKLKENLKTERVLLTKELIEEKEEEITYLETMLLDYQQKRFGSTGDLITQKAVLVKPIQDQVFTAVQDIAEQGKYDFIFDKSSDLTMLFGAQKHNISDKVVRALTRSEKREQLNKKQLKDELSKEAKENMIDDNPELAERAKALEDKKDARAKMLEDRKTAAAEKRKEFEAKRAQLLAEREAKKNGTKVAPKTEEADKGKDAETTSEKGKEVEKETTKKEQPTTSTTSSSAEEKKAAAEKARAEVAADRQKKLEERKAALEEKRKKILEEREAAKKEKEEKKGTPTEPKAE